MTEWFDLDREEEQAVAAFMSRVVGLHVPNPESRIPDPAELWCKATLLRKWEAERRVQRPLDMMLTTNGTSCARALCTAPDTRGPFGSPRTRPPVRVSRCFPLFFSSSSQSS